MSGVFFAQRYIAKRHRENGYIPPDDEGPTLKEWLLFGLVVLLIILAIWGVIELIIWALK